MGRVWTQTALLTTFIVGSSAVWLLAQAQPPDKRAPTFEVASVKPNRSGYRTPGVFRFQPDGSVRVVNMPLRDIIRAAYRLQGYQMDRWPGWLSTEYFDIQAKASGGPSEDTRRTMLQSLLHTRFQLTAHMQTHRGQSFELLRARADGKTGVSLKRSSADCDALRAKLPLNPLPPPPNTPLFVCGIRSLPGRVFAMGVSIDSLASALTDIVGRPVIDRTHLSASFDLDVRYTPDPMPTRETLPPDSAPIDPHGPTIFTALREQLGLKLEEQTGPIETLVIDHVEKPTPD